MMNIAFQYTLLLIGWLLCAGACTLGEKNGGRTTTENVEPMDTHSSEGGFLSSSPCPTKSAMAQYMDSLGLVDVTALDSTLAVRLMYTRADNFTGEILYEQLTEAYLHPDAAQALLKAQRALRRLHPSYTLLIYDAARPMSVQQKMWDVVKGTPKYKYVSNPSRGGGLHNYGLAVDVSIQDSLGQPLPMGTEVDHLGREAHILQEAALVRSGKMSEAEWANRLLLRRVMTEAGFRPLPTEWWHFNYCNRETAKQKYKVIP